MPLLFVLTCLAATRITRLLVRDSFPPIEVQRARVEVRWGRESWQAYLATCPWCMGVYVSAAVVAATWWAFGGLPVPVLWWLAVAQVVGLTHAVDVALDKD